MRSASRGMTLVEVLVALGLTALIFSAALAMAQSQLFVHREQIQSQVLGENLRGAMAQIVRSLRQAGAAAQTGTIVNSATAAPATLPAVQVFNSNPDSLALIMPIDTNAITLLATASNGATALSVDAQGGADIKAGDLLLLSDYVNGVLLQVSSAGTASIQGVPATAVTLSQPALLASSYNPGAVLLRVTSLTYGVQLGAGALMNNMSLLYASEDTALGLAAGSRSGPLAEGILDLEVAVGVDGLNGWPADGTLSEIGLAANDDEWVYNTAGEALPSGAVIAALRVTLAGRSNQPVDIPLPGRPASEDHAAGAVDGYRWRTLTETIYIRNLKLR